MATTIPGMLRAFLLPIAAHFRRLGFRVDAAARGATEDAEVVASFDRVWDVPWSRAPFERDNSRAPSVVRSILERERYDLFHVHSPVAAFLGRLGARLANTSTRIVYTAHGFHFHPEGDRLLNAGFLTLEALASLVTDQLVVMNAHDHQAALRFMPRDRLELMPGIGIDLAAYSALAVPDESVAGLRAELGLRANDLVVLVVAEFIPRKRHVDVIEAFANLSTKEATLVLVGDGPLLDEVRAFAREKLGERCRFIGFRQDVPRLLRISTALVLPSIQEGLPRCVLEAMAMGVPVIGSDIRGTRDLLQGGAGVLVPARSPCALAAALEELLTRPELRDALAQAARQRILEYDLGVVLQRHERLYEKALHMPRRQAL